MEETFLINTPFKSVKVHPVVPFLILEQFIRRKDHSKHLIGTIMGSFANGVLEISNCYTVDYQFDDNIIDEKSKQFNETLYQLQTTSNKNEIMIGWFSTIEGSMVGDEKWYLLNDYYRNLCQSFKPVFLTVNVEFDGDRVNIDAYSVTSITIGNKVEAIKFTKLPVNETASSTENCVLQSLLGIENEIIENDEGEMYNDLRNLKASAERLIEILNETNEYIQKVIDGTIIPSIADSHKVFNAISSVPLISQEEFKKLFIAKLRDFALVSHLSNVACKQVELTETMNKIGGNRS